MDSSISATVLNADISNRARGSEIGGTSSIMTKIDRFASVEIALKKLTKLKGLRKGLLGITKQLADCNGPIIRKKESY